MSYNAGVRGRGTSKACSRQEYSGQLRIELRARAAYRQKHFILLCPKHGLLGEKGELLATVYGAPKVRLLDYNYRIYRELGQMDDKMAMACTKGAATLKRMILELLAYNGQFMLRFSKFCFQKETLCATV